MGKIGTLILVTGPARSGKSEWAEALATQSGLGVHYLATAQDNPNDLEWQTRIAQHQQRRPPQWQTHAVSEQLAAAIAQIPAPQCLLIDSLGTWLANTLDQDEPTWQQTQTHLLQTLARSAHHLILVAEETGWGVVPAYPLGRKFRDRLGTLTRYIGAIADTVYLVTAGYALNLSQLGTPLTPAFLPEKPSPNP